MTPDPVTRAREIVERWESEWTWLGRSPRSKQELIDAIEHELVLRERVRAETAEAALADAQREITDLNRRGIALAEECNLMAFDMNEQLAEARRALKEIERHCPCGARPESPSTHPHVDGCPVARGLAALAPQAREGDS